MVLIHSGYRIKVGTDPAGMKGLSAENSSTYKIYNDIYKAEVKNIDCPF